MSSDETKKRRYTEEEFALILRKASEIQESPGEGPGRHPGQGLTLEEIQSIAAEAGIDPQAVSRAAVVSAEVSSAGVTSRAPLGLYFES